MPDPAKLESADPRLRFWLDTANVARYDASDEEAVRLYAIIWEDLHGRPSGPATTPGHALKYARDFVSHAELGNKDLLDFVERELGYRVNRYDRNDPDHRTFIRRQRRAADSLIFSELRVRVF